MNTNQNQRYCNRYHLANVAKTSRVENFCSNVKDHLSDRRTQAVAASVAVVATSVLVYKYRRQLGEWSYNQGERIYYWFKGDSNSRKEE